MSVLRGPIIAYTIALGAAVLILMWSSLKSENWDVICRDKNIRNVEYVFPARLIGCWLSQKAGE